MKALISSIAALMLSATLSYGYNAWGLYGAYWDTDQADSTGGVGLKISAEMVPGVQLEIRGTYFDELGGESTDLQTFPIEAGLALELPTSDQLSVLAGGGLGYYLMDSGVDDEVGYYLSGGVEWNLKKTTSLFAEAMYRIVTADGAGADGNDLDLDGIGFNAGLLIKW